MELGFFAICITFAVLFGVKLVQLVIFEDKEEKLYNEESRRNRKDSDNISEEE